MNSDFHCPSPDLATIEICKAGWGPGLCHRRFHSEWWFQRHNRTLRISKDAARSFYHDILTTRVGTVPRRLGAVDHWARSIIGRECLVVGAKWYEVFLRRRGRTFHVGSFTAISGSARTTNRVPAKSTDVLLQQ